MAIFPKFSKKRDGVNIINEQRLLQAVNHLILDSQRCTGCGICAESCPEDAVTVSMVGATKRKNAIDYAAPVNIDEVKCSYCGVCVVMCPFNALTLKIDSEERLPIVEKEGFPQYDITAKIDDEKCVRCTTCEDVCPRDAIDRDVPAYEGSDENGLKRQTALKAKTTFEVDDDKCTVCGICGSLCPAITVKKEEFTAETGKVEGAVLWNEDLCDACKVCVESCPEEAITVNREVEGKALAGKVSIIEDDCCTCRWCATNCPTEAITVEKIFEGEIEFHAEKCPGGCSTCAEICPAHAIYLPSPSPAAQMKGEKEANIAVNKDLCVLCGACVNACPGEDIIILKRTGVKMKGKETDLFNKIKAKLFTPRTSKVKEDVTPGEVELKALEQA